jgi:hypothetical protein
MNQFFLSKNHWGIAILGVMMGASLYGCATTPGNLVDKTENKNISADSYGSIERSDPMEIKLSIDNVYRIVGYAPVTSPSTCDKLKAWLSSTEAKDFNIYRHVLPIQERGKPIQINLTITGIKGQECPIPLPKESHSQKDWVKGIVDGLKDFAGDAVKNGKKPALYVFIHGGLNGYDSSEKRIVRDLGPMMNGEYEYEPGGKKVKYYPIFLVWNSGLVATYKDAVFNYDQGQWDKPEWIRLAAPFRFFGRDIPDIVMHSFLNYSKTTTRLLQREWYDDYSCQKLRTDKNLGSEFICKDSQKSQVELDGADLLYWGMLPFRALSVPLVDTVGKVAWKNMVARARFGMRRPCVDVYLADGDACGRGVYYDLFHELQKLRDQTPPGDLHSSPEEREAKAALDELEIILAGHSMGTFVASELVSSFPELPYKDVVFMGAAVSIREFLDSVQRVMIHRQNHYQEINSALAPIQDKAFFDALDSICPDEGEARKIADSAKTLTDKRSGLKEPQLSSMRSLPAQAEACEKAIRKSKEQLVRALEAVEHVQPKRSFDFYNLSLDERAEAEEYNIGASLGMSPRGSLLEWIDDLYETPSDFLERTLGKWKNVVAARQFFSSNGGGSTVEHLHFEKFDLKCDSPKRHGELANTERDCPSKALKYWEPKYWRWSESL